MVPKRFQIPADREPETEAAPEPFYRVEGTPPPTPVFYEGKLIGWRAYGEESITPVRLPKRKSTTRLFQK